MSLESVIITNIIRNEEYFRKIIPFIKLEYFENKEVKIIIKQVIDYFYEYNSIPNKIALEVCISKNKKIEGELYKNIQQTLSVVYSEKNNENLNLEEKWLINQTEKFFQEKSVYNAFLKAVQILDKGNKDGGTLATLPYLFQEALRVEFSSNIGHNYFEDAESRFLSYKKHEEKISTGITTLDDATEGGFELKTLQVYLGGTGTGKTLVFCNHATNAIKRGEDVVYFTMEMSDNKIAQRIDANLLDVNINDLKHVETTLLNNKMSAVNEKGYGRLVIKEYPTGMPSVNNFRNFLDELYQKKKIKPKMVIFDYINLCSSARVKGVNSYEKIKSIAEELRGLAVEYEFCAVTGTQSTREAQGAGDIDLTQTSESWGLPATSDFMAAIIYTDEMRQKGQMLMKILKTRYGDNVGFTFTIGRDNSHMRLFNLEYQNKEYVPPTKVDQNVLKAPQTYTNFNFTE